MPPVDPGGCVVICNNRTPHVPHCASFTSSSNYLWCEGRTAPAPEPTVSELEAQRRQKAYAALELAGRWDESTAPPEAETPVAPARAFPTVEKSADGRLTLHWDSPVPRTFVAREVLQGLIDDYNSGLDAVDALKAEIAALGESLAGL